MPRIPRQEPALEAAAKSGGDAYRRGHGGILTDSAQGRKLTSSLPPTTMTSCPMPSLAEQYRAVREARRASRSLRLGKAEVEGRDRASFLQGMLSNDVKALAPGQGCAAAFLDAHGKVMALLRVYALADRLLLELPPRLTEKTLQLLDKYLISEKVSFEPMDEAYAVLSLQGPRAQSLLEGLAGGPMPAEPHAHAEMALGGIKARVIQRSEFGPGPGFFLWVAPDDSPALTRVAARGRRACP